LTDAQQQELSLTNPEMFRVTTNDDPQCEWRTTQVRVVLSLATNGFNIDQVQTTPGDRVENINVDGHRARVFVNDDDPAAGCGLYLELVQTSYLEIGTLALTAGQGLVDECALARTVARYAINNYPAGAPR